MSCIPAVQYSSHCLRAALEMRLIWIETCCNCQTYTRFQDLVWKKGCKNLSFYYMLKRHFGYLKCIKINFTCFFFNVLEHFKLQTWKKNYKCGSHAISQLYCPGTWRDLRDMGRGRNPVVKPPRAVSLNLHYTTESQVSFKTSPCPSPTPDQLNQNLRR